MKKKIEGSMKNVHEGVEEICMRDSHFENDILLQKCREICTDG